MGGRVPLGRHVFAGASLFIDVDMSGDVQRKGGGGVEDRYLAEAEGEWVVDGKNGLQEDGFTRREWVRM